MVRPNEADFGKIIVFQHESLEACVDAYKKRLNPKLKVDILQDILKWHERLQQEAILVDDDDAFAQMHLRDVAAELVSLICIFVSEFIE
jgi:hypothetical protein